MPTPTGPFTLPELPFAGDALAPHISAATLSFHHGKHHKAYVTRLNELVKGTEFADMKLEQVVRKSRDAMFDNAAQAWNHAFYWNSMMPQGGGEPKGRIAEAIGRKWGSFSTFRDKFSAAAAGQFGSGWAWLVKKADGSLDIQTTANAGTPLTENGMTPLLTCDVWEHAYYVDYRNARPEYIEAWWSLVNWRFAEKNLG